jgi:hypothetical protein
MNQINRIYSGFLEHSLAIADYESKWFRKLASACIVCNIACRIFEALADGFLECLWKNAIRNRFSYGLEGLQRHYGCEFELNAAVKENGSVCIIHDLSVTYFKFRNTAKKMEEDLKRFGVAIYNPFFKIQETIDKELATAASSDRIFLDLYGTQLEANKAASILKEPEPFSRLQSQ